MCWFSPSILVDVGVPGAPSVEPFILPKSVVGHDADATLFLASNRGRHLCYCFRSRCSPASVHRGYRHGHYSRSLLLPYLLYPNLPNDFGVPSAALVVNQSGADPLGRR
jgi:hypothetical protein